MAAKMRLRPFWKSLSSAALPCWGTQIGKTSMLHRVRSILEKRGYQLFYLDCYSIDSYARFFEEARLRWREHLPQPKPLRIRTTAIFPGYSTRYTIATQRTQLCFSLTRSTACSIMTAKPRATKCSSACCEAWPEPPLSIHLQRRARDFGAIARPELQLLQLPYPGKLGTADRALVPTWCAIHATDWVAVQAGYQ